MRAFSIFVFLVIAKLAILAGHPIQFSGWTPIAYFWQDALLAMAFALLDGIMKQRPLGSKLGWIIYAAVIAYVSINVAVARVLSSPLTLQMLEAARGTLSDSIKYHATAENLALMSLVAASGILLPFLLKRRWLGLNSSRVRTTLAAAFFLLGAIFVLLGPLASSRIETIGLDRSPIVALVLSALPRITSNAAHLEDEEWRESPLRPDAAGESLSWLRGIAANRNVVLVMLESAGAEYLKPYGASRDPMPNLSELAKSSVLFAYAYSVYPESIKGLFSVLCSRYPAMDIATEDFAKISTPSIAQVLRQAGYRTALFHSGRFMYLGMDAVVANRGYEVLEDAGSISTQRESSFGVDDQSTVRRAVSWIDSLKPGERFFLTYLPVAGHHPYETPQPGPFPGSTDEDRYLNALYYADQTLGTLISALRDRNLDTRTVFVIMGDHGEAFGQHDGNYGHSLLLYDENVRVPYLIAAHGLIDQQRRVNRVTSLIDTAPTILDMLGIPSPRDYQGRTALDGCSRMALFFTDYSLPLAGLRDGSWKYIYELDSGRSKLFDMKKSEDETEDVSALHSQQVDAYRNLLLRWCATEKGLMQARSDKLR